LLIVRIEAENELVDTLLDHHPAGTAVALTPGDDRAAAVQKAAHPAIVLVASGGGDLRLQDLGIDLLEDPGKGRRQNIFGSRDPGVKVAQRTDSRRHSAAGLARHALLGTVQLVPVLIMLVLW